MRNQDSLHVLYASQAALQYAVPEAQYKQASLRNSTRSLKERRVEPLGNLNNGYTVRTPRGLPFNASNACKKHAQGSQFLLLLPNLTQPNQSKRDSTRR